MASSFVFNPLSGQFDVVSEVELANVGSSPNAAGASIAAQVLTLQPADETNPGVLTAGTQDIGGDKTFKDDVTIEGTTTLDAALTGVLHATAGLVSAGDVDLTSEVTGVLPEANGGTNQSTYTQGDLLYASATNTLSKLPLGGANQVLQRLGAQSIPSWQTINQAIAKNYIAANPNAEVDTAGWATYQGASWNMPQTGTGGTPTITWTRTTSSPLRGAGSFLLTRPGTGNYIGEGASYDFNIDAADQAQVLSISFDYRVVSGTVQASDGITPPLMTNTQASNAGNSSVEVFIYDVTNAVLIPVSPAVLISNSSTTPQTFKGIFQTAANSTSYRLILNLSVDDVPSLWTMMFDNFFVGPQQIVQGPALGDWVPYTPTISQFGTTTNVSFFYKRIGDSIQVLGKFTSGTVTAGEPRISLPAGLSTASGKMASTQQQIGVVGQGAATATNLIVLGQPSLTYVFFGAQSAGAAGLSVITATNTQFGNSTDYSVFFEVPIAGWSSNNQMSNEAATRVVAARYSVQANSSITGQTAFIFSTRNWDTHGGYNVSTGGYTIPVSGFYRVTLNYYASDCNFAYVSKNTPAYSGVISRLGLTSNVGEPSSATIQATAGDIIYVAPDSDATISVNGPEYQFFEIEMIQGPSSITAVDTVSAEVTTTSASSPGANGIIVFNTKIYDTHNAYNASTGVYTAPVSGTYLLTFSAQEDGATSILVYKNSSLYRRVVDLSANIFNSGCLQLRLNAGDTVSLNSLNAVTFYASNACNLSITRVGN